MGAETKRKETSFKELETRLVVHFTNNFGMPEMKNLTAYKLSILDFIRGISEDEYGIWKVVFNC